MLKRSSNSEAKEEKEYRRDAWLRALADRPALGVVPPREVGLCIVCWDGVWGRALRDLAARVGYAEAGARGGPIDVDVDVDVDVCGGSVGAFCAAAAMAS